MYEVVQSLIFDVCTSSKFMYVRSAFFYTWINFNKYEEYIFFIYLIITKIWEQFRTSHISLWFKMSCLTCFVFSCVFCFFLKRWHYIKIFVLHEKAVHLLKCFLTDWQQASQKYNRSIAILRRILIWTFRKWEWEKIIPYRTILISGLSLEK